MVLDIIFSGSGWGSTLSGALEGLGIPWPGAVVLAAAGSKYAGIPGALILGTLFAVAYTAGSALQYTFGRFCRHLLDRLLSPTMRDKLDRAMEKYGQAAVLWTRPLAVGNYISIPAGMMRMNLAKFLIYTFAGIWPWSFGMCLAGGALSQYLSFASDALPWAAATLVLVAIASAVRKLRRRPAQTAEHYGD